MLSSVGVMFATLMFFFFNRDTRCNAFMWLHRNLGMKIGDKVSGQARNLASIVAMETIYVTWFFYIYLLVIYNPDLFGTDHWVTFASCGLFAIWALYLISGYGGTSGWRRRCAMRFDGDHCLERQRDPREVGPPAGDLGAALEVRARTHDRRCGFRA